MRLTKKSDFAFIETEPLKYVSIKPLGVKDDDSMWAVCDILNKLGQLEDIEEELSINLITLFKALKQETLFIKTDFDIRETIKNGEGWGMKHLSFEDGEFVIFAQILYPNDITHKEWLTPLRLKLNDYGKTWALSKEELK